MVLVSQFAPILPLLALVRTFEPDDFGPPGFCYLRPEIQSLALLQKPHIPGDLARRVRETLDHHVSKTNPV